MDIAISLDGGTTFQPAPDGVRVSVGFNDSDERPVDLLINCTEEGVITDVWDHISDEPIGTASQTYDELVEDITRPGQLDRITLDDVRDKYPGTPIKGIPGGFQMMDRPYHPAVIEKQCGVRHTGCYCFAWGDE